MAGNTYDVSYDDMPRELTMLILTKLSPRDLLISISVSKSWNAIIRDPLFAYIHLQHRRRLASISDQKAGLIIEVADDGEAYRRCMRYSREFYQCSKVTFDHTCYSAETSCDGLVLLSAIGSRKKMLLWNPAIRKIKAVPCSGISDLLPCPHYFRASRKRQDMLMGFGCIEYDNRHDYKIVEFLYYRSAESFGLPWPDFSEKTLQYSCVMVYSLSSNSWRRIRAIPPCFTTNRVSRGFVNGSTHWLAKSMAGSWMVMGFDLLEEAFWEVSMPDHGHNNDRILTWHLAVLEGCLSAGLHFQNEEGSICMEIWVMKEHRVAGSWSKLYVVGPAGFLYPVGCLKNRRVLLENRFEEVCLYHPDSRRTKATMHPVGLTTYLESLVLLDDCQSISSTIEDHDHEDKYEEDGKELGRPKAVKTSSRNLWSRTWWIQGIWLCSLLSSLIFVTIQMQDY